MQPRGSCRRIGRRLFLVGGPSRTTGAGNRCVLSATASIRCAEPYTDSKFEVVATGWTFVAGSWNYEATKTSTKHLKC